MHLKLPHQEEGFGSERSTVSSQDSTGSLTSKQVEETETLQAAAHESLNSGKALLDGQGNVAEKQSLLIPSDPTLGGAKGGARSEHFDRGASAVPAQESSDDSIDFSALNGDTTPPAGDLNAGSLEPPLQNRNKPSGLSLFAKGFFGPVPLSSLGSPFQEFVLQTIASEVLKEVRYGAAGKAGQQSRKMSAAKQVAVSFDDVREKNLKQLRKLNQVLFPVRYEEKFYTDVLSSGEYTKLAYYSDICVGAIASKLEKRPEGGLRLYIMTLGVLAPYRRLGIASKLLQHCLDLCHGNAEVHEAYLHVQTSRYEAIAFYKKFGFEIVETLENYYKRIDPPHAYVLMKTLQPSAES